MEKYATYDYYKNTKTGKIKKISKHEELEDLEKTAEQKLNNFVKITNEQEIKTIEASI